MNEMNAQPRGLNFSCLHTNESLFTNRLYVGLNQTEEQIKKTVFVGDTERRGLGMTQYGIILGFFLNLIGIAFKTEDVHGNKLYVNKMSFCKLIIRLHENNDNYTHFNPDFVEGMYNSNMDQLNLIKINKLFKELNEGLASLPQYGANNNIAELSLRMLTKV